MKQDVGALVVVDDDAAAAAAVVDEAVDEAGSECFLGVP